MEDIDQAIEEIAVKLVRGLVGPPTDLEGLAYRLGVVDIRRDDTMIVPGELRKLGGDLVVYLLPNLTKTRRRFTLAHELGHAVFETTGRRPMPSLELEKLCDKFAAEFLMPRRVFVSYAGRSPDLERIRGLCRTFETGLLATLGRAADVYGYRAFELDGDVFQWKYRLHGIYASQVREFVGELSKSRGTKVVELYERGGYSRWELQWDVLDGRNHRIGLLRPA